MDCTPLACALTADDQRCAADELLPGLARDACTVARTGDLARFEFHSREGIVARIAAVIEREQRCCPFFEFRLDVSPTRQLVILEITGPAGTGDFLASLSPVFR
jgi:hypothetical protein